MIRERKLRADDKRADAREQLAALERISTIVEFDLFGWADIQGDDDADEEAATNVAIGEAQKQLAA